MIVVTTPTGAIGAQVLARLLDGGAAVRVIARDAARLPPGVRARVEVVEGSHGEASVVERAFAGARAVFWLPPPNSAAASLDDVYAGFTRPAAEAFARCGFAQVVGVSGAERRWPPDSAYGYAILTAYRMPAVEYSAGDWALGPVSV